MRDYAQYCPIALGSEVMADRWTPLILRELVLGSTRFNEIERGLPGISRTLLAQRLKHLDRKGVLQRRPAAGGRGHEYELTPAGKDLEPVIMAMGEWAVRWLYREPMPEEVDAVTLTWWMHRRIALDQLPPGRVVIEFDYDEPSGRRAIWLVLDRGDPSVCMKPPGFETDVVCSTRPVDLQRVFSGVDSLAAAQRDGKIVLSGPPRLVREFGSWFLWSPFHDATVAHLAGADR